MNHQTQMQRRSNGCEEQSRRNEGGRCESRRGSRVRPQTVVQNVWSWILAIIGVIIIILLLSQCGSDSSSSGDTAIGGNSNNSPSGNTTGTKSPGEVKGSSDASGNTDSVSCGSLDALGILHSTVTVSNKSSDTSNYSITISAVSSVDNTTYADAVVSINGLQPNGNTTEASVFLMPVPSDSVCKVTSIVRVG